MPGPGARLGALVAARQAAPAAELGESVLDPTQRPDRDEAARALRWRLDVEPDVLALGEPRKTAVGVVADDGPHARKVGEAVAQELASGDYVVRSGGVRTRGPRQPEDLDEERPLRADRPATSATGLMERRPIAAASTVWASTLTIDGSGSRAWSIRMTTANLAIAWIQTPFARQRRHWAQTAVQFA